MTQPFEVQVGYIGLGAMGCAMATLLQRAAKTHGKFIYVYNRSADKAAKLLEEGAKLASSAADLAGKCHVIFSCLANDAAVDDIFRQIQPYLTPQHTYVDSSTILPSTVNKIYAASKSGGFEYVASPVFGRPEAAWAKSLVSIPGGAPNTIDKIKPYLEAYSRAVVIIGTEPSAAVSMKLSGNFMIASLIDMVGQSMTLAEKNHVSRDTFMQVLRLILPAPILVNYAQRLANDELECGQDEKGILQGFVSALAIKDVGHMQTLARESGVVLPFADVVMQHLVTLTAQGHGHLDWTAIGAVSRQNAGLPLTNKDKDDKNRL